MHARLIWRLPAAWGLYYSCLDRELSLKALDRSQAPGETEEQSNVQLSRAWIIKKARQRQEERKTGVLYLPFTAFTWIEFAFASKFKKKKLKIIAFFSNHA